MKAKMTLVQIFVLFAWMMIGNLNILEGAELPRRSSGPALQNLSQRVRPELRRRTESPINFRTQRIPIGPTITNTRPLKSFSSSPGSRILSSGRERYVPGEIIMKLRRDTTLSGRSNIQGSREIDRRGMKSSVTGTSDLEILNQKYGVRRMDRLFQFPGARTQGFEPKGLELWRVYRLKFRSDINPEVVAREYEKLAEVEYAEPNYLYTVSLVPNDPLFSQQYALQRPPGGLDAVGAWDIEIGSSRIIIGVLDTGVDPNHEELQGRVLRGPDLVNEDSDPMDDQGHGTHISGIIAAKGNNGKGVAGMCWECRILAIKVADSSGGSTNAWIAQGIVYAANLGVQIINMSLGGFDKSKTLELAVKHANSRGVLLVAAIGNEATNRPVYPAAYPGVMAVGATDVDGSRASFSNYGNYLALMAPGVSIYSSSPRNSYQTLSGTSMSTAFVSGVATLILSKNSSLSASQVRQILIGSTDDIGISGKDDITGYGRVNARKALGGSGVVSRYSGPTNF